MLIQCLSTLFSGEVKYLESRQDSVSPDVIEKKANTVIVPDKFKADVEALEKYIGHSLENGLCIKVDLAELLGVSQRTLARYREKGLIRYYNMKDNGKNFYLASEIQEFLKQRGR